MEAGPRWQNLGIGGGSAFEAMRASARSSGHSSMEGARERSDPRSLTGARGRANPASAAAPRCPSPSLQGRQRKWALPARGRQRRMLGGADPGSLDRGPAGWVFARRPSHHPKGRCEGRVKLDDRSSRGVVKRLMTRVARRGFFSDGRAAPAQARTRTSSVERFGWVHVPLRVGCRSRSGASSPDRSGPPRVEGESLRPYEGSLRDPLTTEPRKRGVARSGRS